MSLTEDALSSKQNILGNFSTSKKIQTSLLTASNIHNTILLRQKCTFPLFQGCDEHTTVRHQATKHKVNNRALGPSQPIWLQCSDATPATSSLRKRKRSRITSWPCTQMETRTQKLRTSANAKPLWMPMIEMHPTCCSQKKMDHQQRATFSKHIRMNLLQSTKPRTRCFLGRWWRTTLETRVTSTRCC